MHSSAIYNFNFKYCNDTFNHIAILQLRRIKLCRGQLFLNRVKVMLFISDIQYYIPVKLCKTASSIHLFKITWKITTDKVKHYVWVILEIYWREVKVTFNGKVINLPQSITIKLWDKFKVRLMMRNQPLLFHLMLKQGFIWFMLTQENQEVDEVCIKLKQDYIFQKFGQRDQPHLWFYFLINMDRTSDR